MKIFREFLSKNQIHTSSVAVIDTSLQIRDCNRTVNLFFHLPIRSQENIDDVRNKIKILRTALDILEENIEERINAT